MGGGGRGFSLNAPEDGAMLHPGGQSVELIEIRDIKNNNPKMYLIIWLPFIFER